MSDVGATRLARLLPACYRLEVLTYVALFRSSKDKSTCLNGAVVCARTHTCRLDENRIGDMGVCALARALTGHRAVEELSYVFDEGEPQRRTKEGGRAEGRNASRRVEHRRAGQ